MRFWKILYKWFNLQLPVLLTIFNTILCMYETNFIIAELRWARDKIAILLQLGCNVHISWAVITIAYVMNLRRFCPRVTRGSSSEVYTDIYYCRSSRGIAFAIWLCQHDYLMITRSRNAIPLFVTYYNLWFLRTKR